MALIIKENQGWKLIKHMSDYYIDSPYGFKLSEYKDVNNYAVKIFKSEDDAVDAFNLVTKQDTIVYATFYEPKISFYGNYTFFYKVHECYILFSKIKDVLLDGFFINKWEAEGKSKSMLNEILIHSKLINTSYERFKEDMKNSFDVEDISYSNLFGDEFLNFTFKNIKSEISLNALKKYDEKQLDNFRC